MIGELKYTLGIMEKNIVKAIGEARAYHQKDEYFSQRIKEIMDDHVSKLDKCLEGRLSTLELNDSEARALGFMLWDGESDLRLIPLWLVPYINEDTWVLSVDNGEESEKIMDAELDTRFGCIAYGIHCY